MKLKHKPKWVVFDVGGVLVDWREGPINVSKHLGIENKQLTNILKNYHEDMELGVIILDSSNETKQDAGRESQQELLK